MENHCLKIKFIKVMTKYHDSHVHLEMLLEKTGLIPAVRNRESFQEIYKNPTKLKAVKFQIEDLLKNHDFVWHSTVSFENLLMVWYLFGVIEKIWYLFGSHPEIVKEGFNVDKYLKDQAEVWDKIKRGESVSLYGMEIKTKGLYQKIVGIGEVGLDYYYTQNPELIKLQKQLFEVQIKLGLENQI